MAALEFLYTGLRTEAAPASPAWQVLASLSADFSIQVFGSTFFSAKAFPILEFVEQAGKWIEHEGDSLSFASSLSQVTPQFGFFQQSEGYLRPYSVYQDMEVQMSFDVQTLQFALIEFIRKLEKEIWTLFEIEIECLPPTHRMLL